MNCTHGYPVHYLTPSVSGRMPNGLPNVVLDAIPLQIPREKCDSSNTFLDQRSAQTPDQLIHELSLMPARFRDQTPSHRDVDEFLTKLNILISLGHPDLIYFVRQVNTSNPGLIPVPGPFIKNWIESKLPTCSYLTHLIKQRISDPDHKPYLNETALPYSIVMRIFLYLNTHNASGVDALYEATKANHFLFRNELANNPGFVRSMQTGRNQRECGNTTPAASKVAGHTGLAQLQQQAKEATKEHRHDIAFHAYQQITEDFPRSEPAQKAWLEMTWMYITGTFGTDMLPRDIVVEKLVEYTLAGDMGARVQLEGIVNHPDYREEVRQSGALLAIRDIEQRNNDEYFRAFSTPQLMDLPPHYYDGEDDYEQPEETNQPCPLLQHYLPSLAAVRSGDTKNMTSIAAQESIKPTRELLERNHRDAKKPLTQRVQEWENTHLGQFEARRYKKPANTIYIRTLDGKTITLNQVDMNGPVADLSMKLLEHGYPVCMSRIIFKGVHVNNDAHLYKTLGPEGVQFTGSTIHLVSRDDSIPEKFNRVLQGSRVETCGGEIRDVPLMPVEFNTTEKIEAAILRLYRHKRQLRGGQQADVADFIKLHSSLLFALQCLATGGSVRNQRTLGIETIDSLCIYIDLLNRCLDLYKTPFVDRQNGHISDAIDKAHERKKQAEQRIHACTRHLSPETCDIKFADSKVICSKQLLSARCRYIETLHNFLPQTQEVEFSHLFVSPKAANAFKLYLLTGGLNHLKDLTAHEMICLFKVANQYMAEELEAECLISILSGIKYNLFTEEEMQEIMTFMVVPEIRSAVMPLFEFQTAEQGGGPKSLDALKIKSRTKPRAPFCSFEHQRGCLSLGRGQFNTVTP